MALAPDTDLIRAMLTVLRLDPTIAGLVSKVYETVPQKPEPAYPYIGVGPTDATPDDADCGPAEEITVQLDIWSRGHGEAGSTFECRRITDAAKRALHEAELALEDNALATLSLSLKRIFTEPDGITHHGVLQFTAIVETP